MSRWNARDVQDLAAGRATSPWSTWVIEGKLTALSTGRQLAEIQGVEEVLLEKALEKHAAPISAPKRLTLSNGRKTSQHTPLTHSATLIIRDTLFYTSNGKRLTEFRFRPTSVARAVRPIAGRASRVRVSLTEDGRLHLAKGTTHTMVDTAPHRINGLLTSGWSFIGRRVKAADGIANPGVVERTEFVLGRRRGTWSWCGVGRCPPWYGRGMCVMHLSAKRMAWGDVAVPLRGWLRSVGRDRLSVKDVEADERLEAQERRVEEARAKRRRKFLGLF